MTSIDKIPSLKHMFHFRWWWRRIKEASSSLMLKMLIMNLFIIVMLGTGILAANRYKSSLIDLQIGALVTQGQIVASAIVDHLNQDEVIESVGQPEVGAVLRRLVLPTATRARLFSAEGILLEDTSLTTPVSVATVPLQSDAVLWQWLVQVFRSPLQMIDQMLNRNLPIYGENVGLTADDFIEAKTALTGEMTHTIRVNAQGETILSVAVPISQVRAVYGVLMLSTEGQWINDIVNQERASILLMFLGATILIVLSSLYISTLIIRPIRVLARAAYVVKSDQFRARMVSRVTIPDLSNREDEIGDLSLALRSMLQALYDRMAGIETFAAEVAHELKNPLTSLKSAFETFEIVKNEDAKRKLMGIINHDIRRLDRLISDIANASRLDAEMMREHMQPLDLGTFLQSLVMLDTDRMKQAQAPLVFDNPPEKIMILALEGRLGQVLRNLIDNARSFSPEDGKLYLRLVSSQGKAIITLEDEGVGIPDEALERIFERFYSERPVKEQFGQHSGLGLSICRQIMETHEGTIHAENRKDGAEQILGARFVLTFPIIKQKPDKKTTLITKPKA